MHWIAPTEKDSASVSLEKRLWDAADQFRANSGLKAQEYSGPILGLIFLRFPKCGMPPSWRSWRRLAVPRVVASEWMSQPPTTPTTCSTSPAARFDTRSETRGVYADRRI